MGVGHLAMLSDCRTAALVTLDGAVEWWPGPRFDGPSVFSRLLDADAGHFTVRPVAPCSSRRTYLDGTLVLETSHDTGSGVLRVTDALAFEPGARGHEIGFASPDALVRVVEAVGGDYAWLRDASLIARALLAATCADEAQRYFRWITRAAVSCRESSHVQIVFGAGGERMLDERAVEHLEGFEGNRPVRIGNDAWRQRQLDVLGEVLDVALALGDDLELDDFSAAFLCQLVDRAAEQWRETDSGVWERRDGERRHTVSAVMCWVALDRGVQLAQSLGTHASPERWARVRDEIRECVLEQAWCERRGAFAGVLGGDELDAAVLLMPLVGFLEAGEERMRRTMAAIDEVLGEGGLHRRLEGRDDEGAFLLVTFWMSSCLAMAGEVEAARAAFERAAGCANDVGLLAEMADPGSGEPRGNVPQALSHIGLIYAAQILAEADERVPA